MKNSPKTGNPWYHPRLNKSAPTVPVAFDYRIDKWLVEDPCDQEGSPEFVSYDLCQVIFHLVKIMHNDKLEAQRKMVVTNFFVLLFTPKPDSTAKMRTLASKQN